MLALLEIAKENAFFVFFGLVPFGIAKVITAVYSGKATLLLAQKEKDQSTKHGG